MKLSPLGPTAVRLALAAAIAIGSASAASAGSCGNGMPDVGEQCDDGNVDDGDGCNSLCQAEDGAFGGPFEFQGRRYYLLPRTGWASAQARARALGGNLATIDGAGENDFLVNSFGPVLVSLGESQFFVGLTDNVSEGSFFWASGSSSPFRNYASGEPTGGAGEDFVAVAVSGASSGQWFDVDDTTSAHGIVEVDAFALTFDTLTNVGPGGTYTEGAYELTHSSEAFEADTDPPSPPVMLASDPFDPPNAFDLRRSDDLDFTLLSFDALAEFSGAASTTTLDANGAPLESFVADPSPVVLTRVPTGLSPARAVRLEGDWVYDNIFVGTRAPQFAFDAASAAAYTSGWSSGADGGVNWGSAWILGSGATLAASGTIDTAGFAFRIEDNGSTEATRSLDAPLAAGSSLRLDFDTNLGQGGFRFAFFDVLGTQVAAFGVASPTAVFWSLDATPTTIPFNEDAQRFVLRRSSTSPAEFTLSVELLDGTPVGEVTATLGAGDVSAFAFGVTPGAGETNALFVNTLRVPEPRSHALAFASLATLATFARLTARRRPQRTTLASVIACSS